MTEFTKKCINAIKKIVNLSDNFCDSKKNGQLVTIFNHGNWLLKNPLLKVDRNTFGIYKQE